MEQPDFGLAFVRVPQKTRKQVAAGESVPGTLRPKGRGDGPKHGPAESVFEPTSDAVAVETTNGPAIAPSWMVAALEAAGRSEPFEVEANDE